MTDTAGFENQYRKKWSHDDPHWTVELIAHVSHNFNSKLDKQMEKAGKLNQKSKLKHAKPYRVSHLDTDT